ncbi:MAG: hypothetical protein ACYTBX_16890 [Planctomycetota bacterium]|jgi:hypothetical protein
MEKILVICGNKGHLKELVSTINQRDASVFIVESFAKTSDLNGTTASNVKDVRLIVLSLVGGKADPPWDLFMLGLRFRLPYVPVIVELDEGTSQKRAYRMIEWGAWDVFGTDENVGDVIERVINSQ